MSDDFYRKEKYVSPYGFNFGDPNSLKRAYGILSRITTPERKINSYNNFSPTYTAAPPAENYNRCVGGVCRMSTSEHTSRGSTTPY